MRAPRLLPLLAALALLPTLAAHATTVNTGKPAASQPATRAFASREQLRDCMDTEDGLKVRFNALEASNAAHELLFNQIESENAKLTELEAVLDHDSDAAVRGFNAAIKEHNEHVRQLNEQAAQSRPVSSAYNEDMAAYNRRCAPLVYRVEDMDAVMKERRKAAAASAASAASR